MSDSMARLCPKDINEEITEIEQILYDKTKYLTWKYKWQAIVK